MKERPILFNSAMVRAILAGDKTQTRRVLKWPEGYHPDDSTIRGIIERRPQSLMERCQFGQPGDRLWVRETIRPSKAHPELMAYAADDTLVDLETMHWPASTDNYKAIPSIHMPRWASRILLEVVSVRVERLQDISEADAQAEGCSVECMTPTGDDSGSAIHGPGGFIALWESINGPDSWLENPWLWVIEFRRGES